MLIAEVAEIPELGSGSIVKNSIIVFEHKFLNNKDLKIWTELTKEINGHGRMISDGKFVVIQNGGLQKNNHGFTTMDGITQMQGFCYIRSQVNGLLLYSETCEESRDKLMISVLQKQKVKLYQTL